MLLFQGQLILTASKLSGIVSLQSIYHRDLNLQNYTSVADCDKIARAKRYSGPLWMVKCHVTPPPHLPPSLLCRSKSLVPHHFISLNFRYISLAHARASIDIGPIEFDSSVSNDVCNVCGGDGKSCLGCDGVPNRCSSAPNISIVLFPISVFGASKSNQICLTSPTLPLLSGKVVDICGICGGDGSSCSGCDNPDSGRVRDDCGVCNGKGGCVPFTLDVPDKRLLCSLNPFNLAFTASFPRARARIAILNSSHLSPENPSYISAVDIPPALVKGFVSFDSPANGVTASDPWSSTLQPRYLPDGSYIALIFVMSPLTSAASNFTAIRVRAVDSCGVCGGDGSSCSKPPSVIDEILAQYVNLPLPSAASCLVARHFLFGC